MNEYHHGDLKRQLLEEGLKLFSEDGYKNFSMRKLAQRCKVSHTSPYRHFSDKEDLIKVLAREVQEKFNDALKKGMDETEGSSREKLKGMGRGYIRFFMENPEFLELLFLTPEVQDCGHHEHDPDTEASFITYIGAVMAADGGDKSDSPVTDPEKISGQMLQPWCLIHGLTVLLVKKAIPVTSQDAVDRLIDEVLSPF